MLTGIGLFLGWENGDSVRGIGIWPMGMANEILKNGNGIVVMWVDLSFSSFLSSFLIGFWSLLLFFYIIQVCVWNYLQTGILWNLNL